MHLNLDVQTALSEPFPCQLPSADTMSTWIQTALSAAGADGDYEITVRFADPEEIRELNNKYRSKDAPTNILSFPFESPVPLSPQLLGDLVICAKVAASEAQEQQKSLDEHLAHLCIHGTLHLLGYDHLTETEATAMESLEIRALAELGISDPYQ